MAPSFLSEVRDAGASILMRRHPSDRQGLGRWDDKGRQTATQAHPLDLPEFGMGKDGCELQGMVRGSRRASSSQIEKFRLYKVV